MTQAPHRFPCDACGSDFRFDPARGLLVCDYCGNTAPVEDRAAPPPAIRELDIRAALGDRLNAAAMEDTQVVSCSNCGARFDLAPGDHADTCPFCATPVVTGTGPHRQIKPQGVLPFALTEEQARDAMTDWLGRLWFAPSGLQQYARKGRRMDGVYVPFWTFDARTETDYRGQRGTVYTTTRVVMRDGKRVQVQDQQVRWTRVRGHVARAFDDILVLASTSLPKRFTDALAPWDLSALVPYTPHVLAGFRAEAYSVDLDTGFAEAEDHMDRVIERDVRFDIGGDRQRIDWLDTDVSDVTFKHVLLPVWVAAYKYRGRTYRFVVNGRSGRVRGERPWSVWKIAVAVVLALAVAAGLGALYAANQGG